MSNMKIVAGTDIDGEVHNNIKYPTFCASVNGEVAKMREEVRDYKTGEKLKGNQSWIIHFPTSFGYNQKGKIEDNFNLKPTGYKASL